MSGFEIADMLADMICFHARSRENGEAMMKPFVLKKTVDKNEREQKGDPTTHENN